MSEGILLTLSTRHFQTASVRVRPDEQHLSPHPPETAMNIRNATVTMRHRKNALFEQERTASLDYDKQRSGGTPGTKEKSEDAATKPKAKKSSGASH
jgi:hypothetical protein